MLLSINKEVKLRCASLKSLGFQGPMHQSRTFRLQDSTCKKTVRQFQFQVEWSQKPEPIVKCSNAKGQCSNAQMHKWNAKCSNAKCLNAKCTNAKCQMLKFHMRNSQMHKCQMHKCWNVTCQMLKSQSQSQSQRQSQCRHEPFDDVEYKPSPPHSLSAQIL